MQTWNTPNGKIDITFSMHSVAVTGYDHDYVYVNDPYGYKTEKQTGLTLKSLEADGQPVL